MVESGSGGAGVVMSGSEAAANNSTPTSVTSTVPSTQLNSATGEEESASTAASAIGNGLKNFIQYTAISKRL